MNRFSCFYFSNCYFFFFFALPVSLSLLFVLLLFFVFVLLSFDFVWMPKNSHLLWLFGTTAFEYELPTRCKCTYINNWICIQLESKRNYVKRQKIMYKQQKKLDREKKSRDSNRPHIRCCILTEYREYIRMNMCTKVALKLSTRCQFRFMCHFYSVHIKPHIKIQTIHPSIVHFMFVSVCLNGEKISLRFVLFFENKSSVNS